MSINTLKRKTYAKYKNNSVAVPQFSLNGTRRSQGYVGQDMRGRSLPKTIMKGNVPKGHGGCCGKYTIKPIVQSAVTSLNNPSVVKSSVLGTQGMIMTKYRWIRRPQPYSTTKTSTSFSQNNFTQSQRIENKARITIANASALSCQVNKYTPTAACANFFRSNRDSQRPGKAKICLRNTKDLTDPITTPKHRVAMMESDYIRKLVGDCRNYDKKFPAKIRGAPTCKGCNGN